MLISSIARGELNVQPVSSVIQVIVSLHLQVKAKGFPKEERLSIRPMVGAPGGRTPSAEKSVIPISPFITALDDM